MEQVYQSQTVAENKRFISIYKPVVPAELPNLLIAVQECLFFDKFINFKNQDTGEHVLTGLNFHHVQNFLEILEKQLGNSKSQNQNTFQPKLKTSFLPKIQESLKGKSETLMAKSPNKHNRIFASSQKIQPELYNLITNEELFQNYDPSMYFSLDTEQKNLMRNYLKEHIQIEQSQDQKIFQPQFDLLSRLWSFGLPRENGNILLDNMHGVQFKNEHKDSQIRGFNWVTQEGPLTENNITKLQTNLNDFTGMSDAIHRGGGQIIPAMRYVVISTYLSAQPTINVANFKVKLNFNIKDLQKIKDIVQKYSVTIEKENENKPY
ncbi:Ribosomal protein S5 domain 2-type fold [Pseudocohnilembus persalinus]|uniref:Ribosomal protein S5 domain 2-type fold n=1 Tax=Pseudocohnilembus persalinus TaxID=266149 RepID=A0A0V0Q8T4_PSEPJ|nr:Ribosomal protein S5 domain 2-type fold [Pseudocohnilembus persalinus]|eukprot:KRW98581.1 Ribosomal protein S5 domain 2-type fold [Pseudocohnilembus persalinus]